MENIHQTIFDLGIEEARRQAMTSLDRQVIETAYNVMSDEDQQFGIVHAGFAMSSLPHKETKENTWIRHGNGIKLRVESGKDQYEEYVGLPYGATARMILIYLQSRAVAERTREIELGKSMYSWLNRMGIPLGGKTYARVREQAKRLSYCHLTFFKADPAGGEPALRNGAFVRDAIPTQSRLSIEHGQRSLWRETVVLEETFYQSLIEHPLPVREAAISSLSGRSVAIDVYIWLSYRLYKLKRPTPISWAALMAQFGHNYNDLRNFKTEFKAPLQLALAAYEGAKVEIGQGGVILHPSPPAVPLKTTVSLGRRLIPTASSSD
jgi:hypothetical protein